MQPGMRARPPPGMLRPDKQEFFFADFDGPTKKRRCTDILFLLLILLSWAIMVVIGLATTGNITVRTIDKGDPNRLFHGMDYMGNLCGIDDPVKDLKYKWDPNYNYITISSTGDYVPAELGICVDSCPSLFEYRSDPYGNYGIWAPLTSTSRVLNFCIPVDATRAVAFARNTVEDFSTTIMVAAAAGFVLSGVLSYLFLISVRIPYLLRFSVWVSICVVLLLLAAGAFLMLQEAKAQQQKDGADAVPEIQINLLKGLGIFLAVCALLWLCLVIYLREKIALAISLIYETSKAVTAIPMLMLSPFFNGLVIAAFTFVWLTVCGYLITSGDIEDVTVDGYTYKEAQVSEQAKKALLFMAFLWLWTASFVHAASQWICAHTVLSWYFRPEGTNVGSCQVIRSTGVFMRYHVGTVAFGSLILAVVQFVRSVLLYIKLKLNNKSSFPVKFALCCCSCCLFCLSKCIKFIDKHAYIHSALSGTALCPSAMRAFGLILRNLGRVATISILSTLVVFVGKVSITLCSAWIAYYYMKNYMEDDLNGFVVPTLFVGMIAYICASLFLDTVTMTSDTVLQGFLVDEEMKVNDDGVVSQEEAIRHHYNDTDLKSYMRKRQLSNPDLFRWNSVENERRVAIDYGDTEGETGPSRRQHGAEIELRRASNVSASGRVYSI